MTGETNEREEVDAQNQSTINMTEEKREGREETTGVPHIVVDVELDRTDYEEVCHGHYFLDHS